MREALVERYHRHPLCDIGDIARHRHGTPQHRHFLSLRQQCAFKHIVSLEGIDVASNLKWIMSSRSFCFMLRPRFETWFLESTLVPGRHYV